MAQPEVAPNVTTGITQVMLIRKSGGATGGASSENTEGAPPVYIHITARTVATGLTMTVWPR